MKKKSVFVALIFFIALLSIGISGWLPNMVTVAESPGEIVVLRVYYETKEDIELLTPFDLLTYNNLEEKYVLILINKSEIVKVEKLGFTVAIDEKETLSFKTQFGEKDQSRSIPNFPCYRTVEETFAAAQDLTDQYPTLAAWTDQGDSWNKATPGGAAGYDMWVLTLTNQSIDGEKPVLFITAALHARELSTAELAIRFAETLLNNYNQDADATWLLDHHVIHIMLQANPDGRKEAESGRSWRKNTNTTTCSYYWNSTNSTGAGVDLNRNFSYMWGTGGSSTNGCFSTYRGASPGSEPETQAIQNFMQEVFSDQRESGPAPDDATGIYLDIHSWGGYVLWSWGYTSTLTPNHTQLQTLGRKFAYYNNYQTGSVVELLYVASGGGIDYAYGELGVAAYAFELGTAFFQDCATFQDTILPDNLPALIYAAKVARTPYITPLGPDALDLIFDTYDPVVQGNTVILTATINDTRYRSGSGEPTQNIAAAEYYIDIPPWEEGSVAIPMNPEDGVFNSPIEVVNTEIDTSGLGLGRHILFVRGQDANGNWGALSAIFLDIIQPTSIDLLNFSATYVQTGILLSWETTNETHNLGFNLYRSDSLDGDWVRLNEEMIPTSVPPGSLDGGVYTYLDDDITPGQVYYYWLEDIDIYTRVNSINGPFQAMTSFSLFLPLIVY